MQGRFDPQVALAVAEAMDMAITGRQLVTVPDLDVRLARIDARFDAVETRMNARFESLKAEIDIRFANSDARIDAKLAKMQTKLIGWIIAMTVGTSLLPELLARASAAIQALF